MDVSGYEERGGENGPGYLRAKLADFDLAPGEDDLKIAVPWTFGAFKAKGGANAYFHGGMSLQELIIPVVTFVIGGAETMTMTSDIAWS